MRTSFPQPGWQSPESVIEARRQARRSFAAAHQAGDIRVVPSRDLKHRHLPHGTDDRTCLA
jgi:hypothetical protein